MLSKLESGGVKASKIDINILTKLNSEEIVKISGDMLNLSQCDVELKNKDYYLAYRLYVWCQNLPEVIKNRYSGVKLDEDGDYLRLEGHVQDFFKKSNSAEDAINYTKDWCEFKKRFKKDYHFNPNAIISIPVEREYLWRIGTFTIKDINEGKIADIIKYFGFEMDKGNTYPAHLKEKAEAFNEVKTDGTYFVFWGSHGDAPYEYWCKPLSKMIEKKEEEIAVLKKYEVFA